LQEFLLLLRNELMMAFKRSQPAVQSLYPLTPTSIGDNQFVAYLFSPTSCFVASSGMKLPQSLVENVRALVERYLYYGDAPNAFEWWVPVLGQYVLDVLDPDDYVYSRTIEGITTTSPVFSPNPTVQTRVFNPEGKESWQVTAEAPIDLVDGFCSSVTPSGQYLFINASGRLQQLADVWNDWIALYDTYCDPLQTMSTEIGATALCSVSATRHWTPPNATAVKTAAAFIDPRLKKNAVLSTPYEARVIVADTFAQPIDAPLYEGIQSKWILPCNKFQLGSQPNDRSTLQAYMCQFSEGNVRVRSSDGNTSITLAALHTDYALKMTHAKNAQKNDWLEAFATAANSGQGGLISGLIAKFAGAAFGDTVGSVAGVIADCLPI